MRIQSVGLHFVFAIVCASGLRVKAEAGSAPTAPSGPPVEKARPSGPSVSPGPDARPDSIAETISFSDASLPVGLSRAQSVRLELKFNVAVSRDGGQPVSIQGGSLRTEEMVERITRLAEGQPAAVLIAYGDVVELDTRGDDTKRKSMAHAGKSYVLERAESGTITSTYAAGGETPPQVEQTAARKDAHFLSRDPIRVDLVGKTLRVGEKAAFLETALSDTFNSRGGGNTPLRVHDASVVLEKVISCGSYRCAVFAIRLDVGGGDGSLQMGIALKGELIVQNHGALPHLLKLEGPIRFAGNNQNQPPAESDERSDRPKVVGGGGSLSMWFQNRYTIGSGPALTGAP